MNNKYLTTNNTTRNNNWVNKGGLKLYKEKIYIPASLQMKVIA